MYLDKGAMAINGIECYVQIRNGNKRWFVCGEVGHCGCLIQIKYSATDSRAKNLYGGSVKSTTD